MFKCKYFNYVQLQTKNLKSFDIAKPMYKLLFQFKFAIDFLFEIIYKLC